MVMSRSPQLRGFAGIFGGAISWYFAHEIGFYLAHLNCAHHWIVPAVHLVALAASTTCVWISYRARVTEDRVTKDKVNLETQQGFFSSVGVAAGALFTLVILWQGVASIFYSGCER
jgi:hypothetical protein